MIIARWNIYQILTKRPEIMHQYFTSPDRLQKIKSALVKAKSEILETKLTKRVRKLVEESCRFLEETELKLPLDHLWLGYSVCTQKDAEDVYYLLRDFQLKKYPKISCGAGILGLSLSKGRSMPMPQDWIIFFVEFSKNTCQDSVSQL